MIEDFKNYIKENNLLSKTDSLLLAVSGGIDSMVMSHLFLRAGFKIGIAHCNFCLRFEESEKDEEFVKDYAGQHNIPFHSKRFNTQAFAKENRLSVQMAARELRYDWFEMIRKENNFDFIAVAHNLNDNIETFLINLTRGTGISGLTGMKPSHNLIIRPLLFATRQTIVEYARENNIIFREDLSNAETKYTRNKIRHHVLPVLKEINPSIEATLNETAERLSEIDEVLSMYIEDTGKKISEQHGGNTIFSIDLLKSCLHNRTILYELFKPYGISGLVLTDLLNIIYGRTGGQLVTRTHRILKNRKNLIISPVETDKEIYHEITNVAGLRKVPGICSARNVNITGSFNISYDAHIACLDSQKISFPLIIRKWRAGDFFFPLGMKRKKKLSDYFVDKKYSIPEKEKALILESAGEIVWIIGERIDDRFRITETTHRALIIRAKHVQS
jgi:tRNA(Ile)-lysidine synthase